MGVAFLRLLAVGAVLASLCAATSVHAADSSSQFVKSFLGEAFGLFRTPILDEAQRREALGDLFVAKMDIPHMARFMTMDRVSSISPAEQKRFEGLLVEYLVDSFYAKIARGATATFDTAGVELVAESSDLAVDTVIEKPGSPPEEITWRLRPAEGGYKIVDVISEGISLAATHRAVFSAVMLVGGLPRLEAMLAARE